MFNALVIHSSADRAPLLRALVADTGQLLVMREYLSVPSSYELSRIMNSLGPDIVVLDFSGGREALDSAILIRQWSPGTAVIGFGGTSDLTILARQVGFSAIPGSESNTESLRDAIREAMHRDQGGVEQCLLSFLPSKAGSGASTLVLNTAVALVRRCNKRVLVLDADLRSGILAIMLNITPDASIQFLLAAASELDQFVWKNSVNTVAGVDFLLSSRSLDSNPPEWAHYFRLLNFARERYDAILVDLPELVNPATVELVRRSRMVFPVCTPEIPSLKLTQHRCQELERWQVASERIGVLLNRYQKGDPAAQEIGRLLGRQVTHTFPNDYADVKAAVANGVPVAPHTRLGRAYDDFALQLVDATVAKEPTFAGKLKGLFSRG